MYYIRKNGAELSYCYWAGDRWSTSTDYIEFYDSIPEAQKAAGAIPETDEYEICERYPNPVAMNGARVAL